MKLELISIPTDSSPLDGLFYSVEHNDAKRSLPAALLFHGNTMNFYTGSLRFLPPALSAIGMPSLAFNRRGHDILAIRNSRLAEGAAFQTAAQAIEDNRLAAGWLAQRGFSSPVVIGHSNGGMLAVQHVANHPDTRALVLLSAHCGGRDMVPRASAAGLLAQDRVAEFTEKATAMVSKGKGGELILLPGWWYAITAESFLDQLENLPDVLALASQIRCPVLYIRGDQEPRDLYPAELFAARCPSACEVRILKNCDHFYNGVEEEVSSVVASWLGKTLHLD
jgi:pimeloyl-ACP methyl ester carboxylesterase